MVISIIKSHHNKSPFDMGIPDKEYLWVKREYSVDNIEIEKGEVL